MRDVRSTGLRVLSSKFGMVNVDGRLLGGHGVHIGCGI